MQRSAASEFLIIASILHAAPADTERWAAKLRRLCMKITEVGGCQ